MITTSASPLTGLVPEFNVFDLPFIVPSEKAADAIFDGPIGAKLAAALEPKGIKLLAYYENGFRHPGKKQFQRKSGCLTRKGPSPGRVIWGTWMARGANWQTI